MNRKRKSAPKPQPVSPRTASRDPKRDERQPRIPPPLPEVLFEYRKIGQILRIHAIDPRTGTEVISIADPRQGMHRIKQLAARKLAYVVDKNRRKREALLHKKGKGYNRIV